MPDLTTLNNAKAWLNVTGNTDDAVLSRLISQVSASIISYIGRGDLFKRTHTDSFVGEGTTARTLRNYPVLDVTSVTVGHQTIPASVDGLARGFWIDPDDGFPPGREQQVHLNCAIFDRCPVRIVYDAGYCIMSEPQIAGASVMVSASNGSWGRDEGASYANGTPMVKVAASPATGQYALGKMPGQYVFAAADAGQAVLISYSYVPETLEQACIELVGERFRYRDRIGQASKNISGEVVSFSLKDMPDYIKAMLMAYHRVVPV